MRRFLRITCKCPTLKERKGRSNFLGSLCLDVPNTAHHHCKCCNTTWEHSVDEAGDVIRRRVTTDILFTSEIVVIEVD